APPRGRPDPSAAPRRRPAGRARPALLAGRSARRRPRSLRAHRGCCGDPRRARSWRRRCLLYQSLYPGDGDANPIGAVVELVAELVHGLLELEDVQQALDCELAGREQGRIDRCEVAVEEALARLLLPAYGRRRAVQELAGARRIREGAEHPGHVAERRALAAALAERAHRLALEVEDHPIVLGPEGLPEVVVAVVADDLPARAGVRAHAQLLAHLFAAAADRREALVVIRQFEEDALDLL